jgi:hypothetical protein
MCYLLQDTSDLLIKLIIYRIIFEIDKSYEYLLDVVILCSVQNNDRWLFQQYSSRIQYEVSWCYWFMWHATY